MQKQAHASKEATDKGPQLGLDRCGELAALLAYFKHVSRDEVLERLGADPREYDRSQRHWLAAIAGELASAESSLAKQFAATFARKQEELADSRPALDSLERRHVSAEGEATVPHAVSVEAAPAAPRTFSETPPLRRSS